MNKTFKILSDVTCCYYLTKYMPQQDGYHMTELLVGSPDRSAATVKPASHHTVALGSWGRAQPSEQGDTDPVPHS